MLIPKKTLEQIEMYTVSIEKPAGDFSMDDVIVLYFRQWWKLRKVIRIRRTITKIYDNDQFRHCTSEDAEQLINQLNEWSSGTFDGQSNDKTIAQIFDDSS